jgi:hypothetical protein
MTQHNTQRDTRHQEARNHITDAQNYLAIDMPNTATFHLKEAIKLLKNSIEVLAKEKV